MGSHISCAAILASNVYGYPYTNSDGVTMCDPSLLLVGEASPTPFERMLGHAAMNVILSFLVWRILCGYSGEKR